MTVTKLEKEFDWREAEITHVKKVFLSTPQSSAVRTTLLKCLILLRYAHFEGFIRNCLNALVDQINREQNKIRELSRPFSDSALEPLIQKIRTSMPKENVCDILQQENNRHLEELAVIREFGGTNNLWPDQLELMFNRVGLKVEALEAYHSTISALIGIRNDIAHGKEIRVKKYQDYEKYEYGALSVCLGVILEVQQTIDEQRFRKQPVGVIGT